MDVKEFRTKYPQYDRLSDEALASGLHKKYYSHVPLQEFTSKFFSSKYSPTDGVSGTEKFLAGAGKAVADTGRGLAQIGMQAADAIPGVDLSGKRAALDESVAESRGQDAALMKTGAGVAGNIAGNIGIAVLPGSAIKNVGKLAGSTRAVNVGKALANPTTYKGAAAQGAVLAGSQPVIGDESRALNATIGGLAGAGGMGVAKTAGKINAPVKNQLTQTQRALVAEADRLGIPLSAAQRTGSQSLKNIEAALDHLPSTAEAAKGFKQQQASAINRVVMKVVGGQGDEVSDEAMRDARRGLSREFERLTQNNQIGLDLDFIKDTNGILNKYKALLPEARQNTEVKRLLDELIAGPLASWKGGQSAILDGQNYQALRTQLSALAESSFRSRGRSDLGKAYSGIIDAMDDAAGRSMPRTEMEAWKKARSQWRALKSVEQSRTGSSPNVSAKKLDTVVARKYRNGGAGDLATVGKIGRELGADVPNSGTAQRTYFSNLLSGQNIVLPAVAGAAAGGFSGDTSDAFAGAAGMALLRQGLPQATQAFMRSGAGQRYLSDGLVQMNTPGRMALADALRTGAVALPTATGISNR